MFFRSSQRKCSEKRVLLNISQNSQENTCARIPFLIRLQACNFFKKLLWHRCFPVNYAKSLRIPFLQNTSARLFPGCLLHIYLRKILQTYKAMDFLEDQKQDKTYFIHKNVTITTKCAIFVPFLYFIATVVTYFLEFMHSSTLNITQRTTVENFTLKVR